MRYDFLSKESRKKFLLETGASERGGTLQVQNIYIYIDDRCNYDNMYYRILVRVYLDRRFDYDRMMVEASFTIPELRNLRTGANVMVYNCILTVQ